MIKILQCLQVLNLAYLRLPYKKARLVTTFILVILFTSTILTACGEEKLNSLTNPSPTPINPNSSSISNSTASSVETPTTSSSNNPSALTSSATPNVPVTAASFEVTATSSTSSASSADYAVSVRVPNTSLDQGAGITVKPLAEQALPKPPATLVFVGEPVQIEPTKGSLHGSATLTFNYPNNLPTGVTADDLMVAAFNEDINAWLPTPATLDKTKHQITVVTNHFSKWGLLSIPLNILKEVGSLPFDIAKDAALNNGDPIKGWMNRAFPLPPKLECTGESNRLYIT